MNQRDESTIVEVDGKSLRLTHLSKVMFPDDGFTKAELLLYYQTIAPLLLPHLRGRPLTLKAFPHGIRSVPITGGGWQPRLPHSDSKSTAFKNCHRTGCGCTYVGAIPKVLTITTSLCGK